MSTTVDLFAGAGGLTEGFRQAGFECLYANDSDHWAAETFKVNHPAALVDNRSVEGIKPAEIRKKLGLRSGDLSVLIGGPPCQGFSINAPERFLDDSRNRMFKHYCRFLAEFKPRTFVFENVPGILSLGSGKVFEQILKELEAQGYRTSWMVLFAAHYGVPQERWRVIILGSRTPSAPGHPQPTHFATGRANFRHGRSHTFRLLPLDRERLLPMVTVQDALADLPRLEMGQGSEVQPYACSPRSMYAELLRDGCDRVYNHFAARLAPQNVERLKHVKPGGSWRDIPFELLPKGMQRARSSDHTKRYGRLAPDKLAGTVMTKCDPHWGAVFLPDQDRALTVREAARLQSFPDRYQFLGPRVSQYVQVGNAVPVLMAKAIGATIAQHLTMGVAMRVG